MYIKVYKAASHSGLTSVICLFSSLTLVLSEVLDI